MEFHLLTVRGLDGKKYYHRVWDEDDYLGDTLTTSRKKAWQWSDTAMRNGRHECIIEGHVSGKDNICSLNMYDEIEVDTTTWLFEKVG